MVRSIACFPSFGQRPPVVNRAGRRLGETRLLLSCSAFSSCVRAQDHDQPEVRPPHALQDAVRHDRRDRVAGARHRRERGDLLAVQPDAAASRCRCRSRSGWSTSRRPAPSRARSRATRRATATRSSATRCSATSQKVQTVVHRHRRAPALRRQPRVSGTDAERRRACWCRAATSRCSACTPALGRLLGPERRSARVGESHVVVLSHAYWPTPVRGGSRRAQPAAHRQRPDADDRRRGAARASTGRRSGTKPQVFVPITLRGYDAARLQGLRQPPELLGVPVRAAEARRRRSSRRAPALNVPYHAIVNDVEAPLQKGMSEQTMARFRAKPIMLEPGGRGQSSDARGREDAAPAAARRHRLRAADRLRQHREPAARAVRGARRRDGGAAVDRRQPRGS